ncbi:MAG: NAD(P)H-hydrate dehydratase [Sideroxydans sp.]
MSAARPLPLTEKMVSTLLPPRPRDSHKGMFGTVAVIGGAPGMIGAALLAGRAAFKLGAGAVHVGLLADKMPLVDMRMPELMLHPAALVLAQCRADVWVVGCGLGTSLPAQKLLYDALHSEAALVLDADALNLIAARPDLRSLLHARRGATVCTPHPGEAARLLGCSTEEVQQDRPRAALSLAQRLHADIVLKGAGSLIASRNGQLHLNQTGNPGMSSAGMGDVLAGMVAALMAQGLTAHDALLLGVYLHGAAADALEKQHATIGMSATEVTEWARWLLNQMIRA